jgi:hypothetical protein
MLSCLPEEITEIYSTPTPKGVAGAEKVNVLNLFDTIASGLYLYPGLLTPKRISLPNYKDLKRKY